MNPVKEVVTIGMFDGVHTGHRKVLETAADCAREHGVKSLAITFDHIPKNHYGALTTLGEKIKLIKEAGLDGVRVLPFERIKNMSAGLFCEKYIGKNRLAVLGYDFKFGKGRSGGIDMLKKYAAGVLVVKPVKLKNAVISSTLIKKLLVSGDLEKVNKYLGRNFGFSGSDVAGLGIGRKIGYPTLNIIVQPGKILPNGIFAAVTEIKKKRHISAVYIGKRPTFGMAAPTVETHIIGRKKVQAAPELAVELFSKIRDDIKFGSRAELASRIKADIAAIGAYFDGTKTGINR